MCWPKLGKCLGMYHLGTAHHHPGISSDIIRLLLPILPPPRTSFPNPFLALPRFCAGLEKPTQISLCTVLACPKWWWDNIEVLVALLQLLGWCKGFALT